MSEPNAAPGEPAAPIPFFRLPAAWAWRLLLLGAATLGVSLALRYGLIQNTPIGLACEAGERSVTCAFRGMLVPLFTLTVFGWVALAASLINLARPSVPPFAIGLVSAALGIVLYNTRLSSLAVALLILSFARARPVRSRG